MFIWGINSSSHECNDSGQLNHNKTVRAGWDSNHKVNVKIDLSKAPNRFTNKNNQRKPLTISITPNFPTLNSRTTQIFLGVRIFWESITPTSSTKWSTSSLTTKSTTNWRWARKNIVSSPDSSSKNSIFRKSPCRSTTISWNPFLILTS